ncbi:6-bladed beta-propeller [Candidatus Aminicenantes bacterium AH-873-B07]|nr:6-bladed beta-propeller [Candidatus Aminicenantes bacterium AH-873-B07]
MRQKIIFILFIFSLFNHFTISQQKSYQIIISQRNPIYGNLKLKLKKDLVIGNETSDHYIFGSINGIEVNDKYIYVLDAKMARVQVYDLKGNYIKTIGRKGNGPGEFLIPNAFHLSKNGNIYVWDLMRGRMVVFDKEGNYKKDIISKKISAGKFYVDENEFIYTRILELETGSDMYTYFVKINSKGKVEKILKKQFYLSLIITEKMRLFYEHPYLANLYFAVLPDGNFVLMNSLNYELTLLSPEGKILLRIRKKEKSKKVTQKEKEIIFSTKFKNFPKHLRKYVIFSKLRPYCSNLLIDDKGRIYVERFKPVTEKNEVYIYDIFNKKGEYLYKLELDFRINLIKNGFIYTAFTNEETGEVKVFRYKIENWEKIKF